MATLACTRAGRSAISLHALIQNGSIRARTRNSVSALHGLCQRNESLHLPNCGRRLSTAVTTDQKSCHNLLDRLRAGRPLEQIADGRAFTTSTPLSQPQPSFRSILPTIVHSSLTSSFPSIEHPTSTQASMIKAILDGKDCFVRDGTGMGKTFALVLAILALHIRSHKSTQNILPKNRRNGIRSSNGPRFLILLPNPSLVGQVERWINILTNEREDGPPLVLSGPDAETLREQLESSRTADILVATPSALLPFLNHPSQQVAGAELDISNISVIAVDEVDSLVRPLPGRFSNTRDHSFWRHPPKAVDVLTRLLGRNGARQKEMQTVWMSATINAPMRAWVWQQGWVRRGEDCVTIDKRNDEGGTGTNSAASGGRVKHHCVVVDRVTGKLVDSASETTNLTVPMDLLQDVVIQAPTARGRIHPFIVEAVATLWATASSGPRSHHAIVLPPEGTSVPSFIEDLSSLGVTASTPDNPEGLVIVSRSQVRGLDLPDLDTVYILGGLGVESVSKKMKASGGVGEREREYWHMAGRVGRLRGGVGEEQENAEKLGERQIQRVVTIVMGGSDEYKAMERFMKDERSGMKVEPWPEALL